ncbi:hypothetical protein Bbelb_099240 [Branchiostoma belcheri]|nr:hypothetical protein Bbelb_099240 [Branchiostoma belcheri]
MSYSRGTTDDPLLDVTFGQLLDDTAAKWPDREAYVFKKTGSRITFADIQEKTIMTREIQATWQEVKMPATRLAAGLKAIGTARGDVVAWLFGHRPEWIYLYFALAKLGAIASRVKVLIMGDESTQPTDGTTSFLLSSFPEIETTNRDNFKIKRIGVYTMDEVQTMGKNETLLAEVRALQDQLSCHDSVMLGLTSGSTGPAKCAEQSTYSIHNNIRFLGNAIGLPNEGTALYPYLPFRWAVIYPFTAGCTLVVPASLSPSPVEMMQIIQEERCKSIGVIFVKEFHDFLHNPHLDEYDLSSLERVYVTGNVAQKSLLDHAAKVLPKAKMFVGYGGTEFLTLTTTAAEMVVEGRGATVGKLVPHAEVEIADKDGQVVPLGQEGEVYVRAYSLFNCYRSDEEKTAKAMTADGWYKTGDVGVLDEKGVLKLLGRFSDMIIRDADNVHPTVIESSLSKHPKVQDVRRFSAECRRGPARGGRASSPLVGPRRHSAEIRWEGGTSKQVVGVPDPASVEEICACIILKQGQTTDSEEMTEFCAEIGVRRTNRAEAPIPLSGALMAL